MMPPTMTLDRVLEDLFGFGIGYAVGLSALLVWPLRDTADQDVVWLVGIVILLVTGMATLMWIFKRRPRFGWVLRPYRYSWPNVLGLTGAGVITSWLRSSAIPDRGLLAYTVGALVLLTGVTAANWLWAQGAASRPRDTGAR